MSNFSNRSEHPVIFTMPVLGWKMIDTLQGACFEFGDGSHGWPSPRERQIIEAYQSHVKELTEFVLNVCTAGERLGQQWDAVTMSNAAREIAYRLQLEPEPA